MYVRRLFILEFLPWAGTGTSHSGDAPDEPDAPCWVDENEYMKARGLQEYVTVESVVLVYMCVCGYCKGILFRGGRGGGSSIMCYE